MNERDDFDRPRTNGFRYPCADNNGRRNGALGRLYEQLRPLTDAELAARQREIRDLKDLWEMK